jgi:hypothetical protein
MSALTLNPDLRPWVIIHELPNGARFVRSAFRGKLILQLG